MRWNLIVVFVLGATTSLFAGDVPQSASTDKTDPAVLREEKLAAGRKAVSERVAAVVGEVDAGQGVTSVREIRAELTEDVIIFRYEQLHSGIPVWLGQLILATSRGGIHQTDRLKRDLSVNVIPNLDQHAAIKVVRARIKPKGQHSAEATLMIVPRSELEGVTNVDRLVWKVDIWAGNEEDGAMDRTVFVDAHSGEILLDESNAKSITYAITQPHMHGHYAKSSIYTVSPVDRRGNVGDGKLLDPCFGTGILLPAGTSVDCGTLQDFGDFSLIVARGVGNYVGNANGTMRTKSKPIEYNQGVIIGDGQLGSANARTTAADAYYHMNASFEYLQNRFDYQGLNGSNAPAMQVMVNTALQNGAVWTGPKDRAIQIGQASGAHYPFSSLDVIAHEIGHALGDFRVGLVLFTRGRRTETWAIGEGTSDMFAMLVSAAHQRPELPSHPSFQGDPVPYWIGEETFRANYVGSTFTSFINSGHAIRYMDDPARTPGTVACYYPEIRQIEGHRGSGPAGHMFYLLAYGGVSKCDGSVVEGIGVPDAARIFWTAFGLLPPEATYADLRSAFVSGAVSHFPGPNPIVLRTASAFDAVDVP